MDNGHRSPAGGSEAAARLDADARRAREDANVERLLRSALAADADADAGSSCLDAETLAAWCDGALTPSERSFADAHAARCARCQAMLSVMARTVPVAAEPRPWSLRQWLMMVAPAATAATAVALWFAVEPSRRGPQPVLQQAQQREAESGPAPASRAPVETATPPADRFETPSTPARPGGALADEARKFADSRDAKPGGAPLTATRDAEKELRDRLRQESAARAAEETKDLLKVQSPPAAPPALPVPDVAANNANVLNAGERNAPPQPLSSPPPPSARAKPAAAPMTQSQQAAARPDQQQADASLRRLPSAAAGRGGAGAVDRIGALAESVAVVQTLIASPDGSTQWRVISTRVIQHSVDKGATWATQYTADEKTVILAGAAPSATAAWYVGAAGFVLTTADGRRWQRVPFPEPVDLVAVTATDARNATVTTADQRVFITANAGRSWSLRKP